MPINTSAAAYAKSLKDRRDAFLNSKGDAPTTDTRTDEEPREDAAAVEAADIAESAWRTDARRPLPTSAQLYAKSLRDRRNMFLYSKGDLVK